jgi:hypothetical protein
MWKKFVVLAVLAFGFGSISRANAGTEIVRDYGGGEINDYAPPPPRPVYYAPPPPVVGVVVYPTYGYYGPRYRVYGGHRYYDRRVYYRSHRHWRD